MPPAPESCLSDGERDQIAAQLRMALDEGPTDAGGVRAASERRSRWFTLTGSPSYRRPSRNSSVHACEERSPTDESFRQ